MSHPDQLLTDEMLARRLPVWDALSELFRDTELDEPDCKMIACSLSNSGYTLGELDDIMHYEVAPAFYTNLMGLGEWRGWSRDVVKEIVLGRLAEKEMWYERIPFVKNKLRNWSRC